MTTSPFQQGPNAGVSEASRKAKLLADRAAIQSDTSIYFKASTMEPLAWAQSQANFFNALRESESVRTGIKDLNLLQQGVRLAGKSKDTTAIGVLGIDDIRAIADIFKQGYANGLDWNAILQAEIQSPYRKVGGTTFSKEISTALKRIDKTDAEQRLNDAYFKTFGVYPTTQQIVKFKDKYNAEAQRQLAETKRTRNVTDTGTASSGRTKEEVSGEGFTQAEYDTFLGKFLADNYKITGKEESGAVKNIMTNLRRVYKDNLLPEPSTNELANIATDIIRTGNADIQEQKLTTKINAVRSIAAKMYPGLKDSFDLGTDLVTILDPIVKSTNNYLGTSFDKTNPIFSQILNFNDGKTVRVMNSNEIKSFWETLPEFNTSDAGRQQGISIANALKEGLR